MSDLPTCANPLLLQWIKEFWDTAKERSLKSAPAYKHAYDALKSCPLTFQHPSQCKQLKYFGPKLCEDLTKKLKEHCEANGLPMPNPKRLKKSDRDALNASNDDDSDTPQPAKKPRKTKAYVPAYRSGPYAILLVLATLDADAKLGLSKADLIEAAQPHCDASFTAPPDATKFYTAWNSMKTLLTKELVYERGRPLKRYALTDEGWVVAARVKEIAQMRDDVVNGAPGQRLGSSSRPERQGQGLGSAVGPPNIIDDDDDVLITESKPVSMPVPKQQAYADVVPAGENSTGSDIPRFTPIRLAPGSFTVELVLDIREVRARTDRDYMQEELTKKGVKPIMRALDLGDAMWVAKCHTPGVLPAHGPEGDEVVLDYIMERKRLDDLISSIKDGRFHEQKFRLRRSGVQNVIYLVEEISMDTGHFQKYEEAVQSAMASIQVVEGYFLKQTQKMDDSIRYLTRMTMMLKELYEKKTLYVIPTGVLTAQNYLPLITHLRQTQPAASHHITYPAFASLASKSDMMTLRDVFLKMLMCTKGVTGEKAIEIQKRWKTPYHFVKAFERCGPGEEGKKRKRELVASETSNLVARKKIAKAVSQTIAEVWGDA
jgi:crossover junction endonuclease MUS81